MRSSLAAAADALQQPWQLPFELVDLTPELPRMNPAVVADDGTLFVSSSLPGPAEVEAQAAGRPPGRRFAFAVAARVRGQEHVLASDAWAEEAGRGHLAGRREDDSAWLLRAERLEDRVELLVLRGPEAVRGRRLAAAPVALLVDLGMVLTRFDRALFRNHYQAAFGQPLPEDGYQLLQEVRLELESGALEEDDFIELALESLQLAFPDREAFKTVWGSILSCKRSTVELVRQAAAQPGVAVVIASNTDPITLAYAQNELGLKELLRGAAASFQEGVNPKSQDASLWLKARRTAEQRLGRPPATVIAVDDVRSYLHGALAAGAATCAIHYRSYAQFRYELGAAGLYLPLGDK